MKTTYLRRYPWKPQTHTLTEKVMAMGLILGGVYLLVRFFKKFW